MSATEGDKAFKKTRRGWSGCKKTASKPPQTFFSTLSNIEQQFIPEWPIINVEFMNLLDNSELRMDG